MSKPLTRPTGNALSHRVMHDETNVCRLVAVAESAPKPAAPQPPIEMITFRFGFCAFNVLRLLMRDFVVELGLLH
jgi:hypothetical protein